MSVRVANIKLDSVAILKLNLQDYTKDLRINHLQCQENAGRNWESKILWNFVFFCGKSLSKNCE